MTPKSDASDIIRWMEVPQHTNVFALGNFARQVTFASQQSRAFNLVWALLETNRLSTGSSVAVVGAGVGGLSAVAAALRGECTVDLFEQASQPCPIQRGNDIRFVHPNILRWPDEGCEKNETDFPFLNWTAANVRGVVKQIALQWKILENNPRLRKYFNYKVNRLYVSPNKAAMQRPWISANRVADSGIFTEDRSARRWWIVNWPRSRESPGYIERAYDCIILAVGFGDERTLNGVRFLSYWENDSLHEEAGRERRNILVSGCGDGGLIDALRLRLRSFDHAEFVGRILTAGASPTLTSALLKVDADLRKYALAPDISIRFQSAYDTIHTDNQITDGPIEQYFRTARRSDTSVTLNSPAPGPLSFQASLLNRYSTYLAMRYADLHYLSGHVVAERAEDGRFNVTLHRSDVGLCETRVYDLIIVRHRPESAISKLLPDSTVEELRTWWQRNEDVTIRPRWNPGTSFPLLVSKDAKELALTIFSSAYQVLADGGGSSQVQSVGIGEHDGKTGFVVSLKSGSKPVPPKLYAGVLVQYVITSQPQEVVSQISLPVGVGIYNHDASKRLDQKAASVAQDLAAHPTSDPGEVTSGNDDDVPPAGTGTLGCFATDEKGSMFLRPLADVLSPVQSGQPGDRILSRIRGRRRTRR